MNAVSGNPVFVPTRGSSAHYELHPKKINRKGQNESQQQAQRIMKYMYMKYMPAAEYTFLFGAAVGAVCDGPPKRNFTNRGRS
jgi:hypothetical protein